MKRIYSLICSLFVLTGLLAQNKVVECEYWIDDNYSEKQSPPVSPTETYQWQTSLAFQDLDAGLHELNVRFKDALGYWSSTTSSYFFRMPSVKSGNTIIAYEYWLDDGYDHRVQESVTGTPVVLLSQSLALDSLSAGLHQLNVRFRDEQGQWSSTASRYFQKIPELLDNTIIAYEYWLNDGYDKKYAGTISESQTVVLLDSIDCGEATDIQNVVHFRFRDQAGQWSSVASHEFWKPAEAGFTYIVGLNEATFTNTSQYATQHDWDFGDGNTSIQVNPLHTYAEPGAYEVRLIAQNDLFADTLFQYVEIEGIRAISSNKGGNGGISTVLFYGGGLTDTTQIVLQNQNSQIVGENIRLIAPGILEVEFNLMGKPIGTYDIAISDETTFGDILLPNKYFVEELIKPEVWTELSGRDVVIDNRWQTYTIQYGNKGNVDALIVPVILGFTVNDNLNIDLEFIDFMIDTLLIASEDNYELSKKLPKILPCDTLSYKPFKGKYYPFYIPKIPAGYTGEVRFRLRTNQTTKLLLEIHNPLFEYSSGPEEEILRQSTSVPVQPTDYYNNCIKEGFVNSWAEQGLGYIPVLGCLSSITYRLFELAGRGVNSFKGNKQVQSWGSWIDAIGYTVIGCISEPIELTPVGYFAAAVVNSYAGNRSRSNIEKDCKKAYGVPPNESPSEISIRPQSSYDPNELVGLSGYGTPNYIQQQSHLSYALYFENDEEKATAPAQEIFLADTLDMTRFNPEEFSFGTFTFRDITVEAIPGVHAFSTDVDMRGKGEDIIIRISATFDKLSGVIDWYMVALDPITMDLTENPDLGILYPNINPPNGEGNVTYRIGLRPDLTSGTVINNQAHIVFDLNESLATNVYTNTLDLSKPSSQMDAFYEIEGDATLALSWSGNDTGSGIAAYTVYVSENDGAYTAWLSGTSETSGKYEGLREGNTYKFYVTAVDQVGNEETQTPGAELAITLDPIPTAMPGVVKGNDWITISPNPVKNTATIRFALEKDDHVSIILYDITGKEMMVVYDGWVEAGEKQIPMDVSGLDKGIYLLHTRTSDGKYSNKVIVD